MISFFINACKIVFLLGFLIFIHEGGHFFAAKLCKVKVNEFAIGFGPTIWKKKGKTTNYALRLIPLGGFVSMEGEEERSEEEGSFSKASIPKRIAIVIAGAIVNIVFGLVIYFCLMVASGNYISNEVEALSQKYAAENYGIQVNDKIHSINDEKIHLKEDVDNKLEKTKGQELKVTVLRENQKQDIYLIPTKIEKKATGIYLSLAGNNPTEIVQIDKDSNAQKKGLLVGDVILKINGETVENDQSKLLQLINNNESETICFTIQRKEQQLEIFVEPDQVYTYKLGVLFKASTDNMQDRIYYGYWKTVNFAGSIIDNLKSLFTGKVGLDQMMGPVGISSVVSKTKGLEDFIYILALISLSLGVTNLLPIPALDGGRLLLLVIEAIRRKPLKEKTEINIQMLGFIILIGLSIIIAYQDILRIF